jgi:N-acetylmuramoyl-L-alanine amidase
MLRALALPLMVCASLASAAEVKSVRVSVGKAHTRATVDLSDTADYRVFTLANPDRLVLDVMDGTLRRNLNRPGRGLVAAVRTGQPETDRLRIVFDLTQPVRPKSFLSDPADRNRHRLIIDMQPTTEPEEPIRVVQASAGEQRDVVVAVDAGHGGEDPGAVGKGGTFEKSITLKVAQLLAARINDEPGMRAVLIRDSDVFVPLTSRYEKAREQKADLFISIHADAAMNRNASGSSVYILSTRGASNEAARYLAERENRSDLVGNVSLSDKDQVLASVLLDLSQCATLEASAQAAEHLLGSLTRMGKAHKRYVEHANFVVLRSPDVPSVLVETAFISNADENANSTTPNIGRGWPMILLGVRDYFHTTRPGYGLQPTSPHRAHVVARGETLQRDCQPTRRVGGKDPQSQCARQRHGARRRCAEDSDGFLASGPLDWRPRPLQSRR